MAEEQADDAPRGVRFHGRVQFKTIRHIKDFTDGEIRGSYYRKKDYARMSDEVGHITEIVANDESALNSICTRGLEHLIDETIADYRAEKMIQSVDAVLDEQDDQMDEDIYDPDIIAHIYAEIAAPLLQEAHLVALKDEEDARQAAVEIDQAAKEGRTTRDDEDGYDAMMEVDDDDEDEDYEDEEVDEDEDEDEDDDMEDEDDEDFTEEPEESTENDDIEEEIVSDAEPSEQSTESMIEQRQLQHHHQQQQQQQQQVYDDDEDFDDEENDQPITMAPPQPEAFSAPAGAHDTAEVEEEAVEESQPEPVPPQSLPEPQPQAQAQPEPASQPAEKAPKKKAKKDKASKPKKDKKKASKSTKSKDSKPPSKPKSTPKPPPLPKDDVEDEPEPTENSVEEPEESQEEFMDLKFDSDDEAEDGVLRKEFNKMRTPNKSAAYESAQQRVRAKRKEGGQRRKRERKQRGGASEFSPLARRHDGSFTFRNNDLELVKTVQKKERQDKVKSSLFAFLDDDDYALPPKGAKKKPKRGKLMKKKAGAASKTANQ